jgi:biopolymer transport protein ExbB/TolQ
MEPLLLQASSNAPLVRPDALSLGSLFAVTGWVGPFMLLVAVLGIVLAVKRRMELAMSRLAPPSCATALERAAREGPKALAAAAAADSSLLGVVVAAAASQAGSVEDMRAALDRALAREQLRRGNRMADITRLAWVVLLLGILGTLIGAIFALQGVASLKEPKSLDYAIGIAEALSCAAFGLFFSLILFGSFFLLDRALTRRTLAVAGIGEEIARLAAPSP